MSKKEYQHRTIIKKTDNIRQQLNNNEQQMLSYVVCFLNRCSMSFCFDYNYFCLHSWSPLISSGMGMLSVKSMPVPKPWGMVMAGPYTSEANCAMAFKPTLLSRALVIHEPMPRSFAIRIHSLEPVMPPCNDGFKMMYCGRMVSSRCSFLDTLFTPISSSSRAMGSGVFLHSWAMSGH